MEVNSLGYVLRLDETSFRRVAALGAGLRLLFDLDSDSRTGNKAKHLKGAESDFITRGYSLFHLSDGSMASYSSTS